MEGRLESLGSVPFFSLHFLALRDMGKGQALKRGNMRVLLGAYASTKSKILPLRLPMQLAKWQAG
jgi:hypothetical protein